MKTLSQTQIPNTLNKLFVLKNNNREIFSLFFFSHSTYRRTTLKNIFFVPTVAPYLLLTYKAYIYNRLDINFNKSQPIVHTQFQHCQHNLWPNLQVVNLYDLWRFMDYHPMWFTHIGLTIWCFLHSFYREITVTISFFSCTCCSYNDSINLSPHTFD